MAHLDLTYYMLDWDDNILFMPTKIYLQRNGEPATVTTKEFATVRTDPSYEPLDGDWDQAFKGFRDGTGDFVGDTRAAIRAESFAPSYAAFKRALREARLFCIVTARGHSADTMRRGIEAFIEEALTDDERTQMLENIQHFNRLAGLDVAAGDCLTGYLDLNGYVGVSSPGFLKIFEEHAPAGVETGAAPEEAKTFAVRQFVASTVALADALPADTRRIAFGFSDDDLGNLKTMRAFLSEDLVAEYPAIEFFVYDTSGTEEVVEAVRAAGVRNGDMGI